MNTLTGTFKQKESPEALTTITLTVSQAKELFKLNPEYRNTILHGFTDEDLEIDDRPKSCEELKKIEGYYIDDYSTIRYTSTTDTKNMRYINTFANKAYAESSNAYAQLSQLVEDLNKRRSEKIDWDDYDQPKYSIRIERDNICYESLERNNIRYESYHSFNISPLQFVNEDDARFSIKYHADLWKQFLMIDN